MEENHYVTREEYEQLLAMAHGKRKASGGGCLSVIAWLAVIAAFAFVALVTGPDILVSYGIVSPETMANVLHLATPQPQGTKPTANRPATGGSHTMSSGGGVAPLPDCASVTDTTTACRQGQTEPTPAVCQPAPAPEGVPICGETEQPTPAPAYVSTCQTEPGARPCWLPADQAWEAPADVPATPVVLLPEPTSVPLVFSDSACAAWHAPLPWPKECQQPND